MEELEHSYTGIAFWKNVWQFLKKLNSHFTFRYLLKKTGKMCHIKYLYTNT